jgi:hypothetical protein
LQNRYQGVTGALRAGRSMALMNTTSEGTIRELASRERDGLAVILFWHEAEDSVTVSVADSRTGDRFELAVKSERALDAFYHPFAYAS